MKTPVLPLPRRPKPESKSMFGDYRTSVYRTVALVIGIQCFGVIGYMWVEGLSFVDALYMTIITISTVGFGETKPFSAEGKLFSVGLIIVSITTLTYSVTRLSAYVLDGRFAKQYKRYRISQKVNKLRQHVIVCGYGRIGHEVCETLHHDGVPFVVIEQDNKIVEELLDQGMTVLEGDATKDDSLIEANIEHAEALISTLPEDAANVFVVLTARQMNPSLTIISRAYDESTTDKLRRAGADNIIMPHKTGGNHMASLVIKPDIMEFIDLISGGEDEVSIDELTFHSLKDEYHNRTIGELDIRRRTGANIIGYRRPDGHYVVNPPIDMAVEPGAKIIVLGTKDAVRTLRETYTAAREAKEAAAT